MICISYYLRALIERISIGFEFKTWINSFFHLLMRTLKSYTYDTIILNVTRLVPNKILDVLLSINELSMIKLVQKKKKIYGLVVRNFLPISFAVFLDCSINVSQISKYSQLQCQTQKNNFNLNFNFF